MQSRKSTYTVGIILLLLSALLAVALPLATYALSLAVFGLPHVFTELRYLDSRFSKHFPKSLIYQFIVLLTIIAVLRIFQFFALDNEGISVVVELSCVVGLVFLVTPILAIKSQIMEIVALAVCLSLIAGILFAPNLTLLFFAVGHNLTPIGFLTEKLEGHERIYSWIACFFLFLVIPVLIIFGLPHQILASWGLIAPDTSLLAVGSLDSHLGVFVPEFWQGNSFGERFFSAVVFLQCLHYAIVLGIFPRWTKQQINDSLYFSQLKTQYFNWIVRGLSSFLFMGFLESFTDARAIYGILAAIHAWIEIPLLLYSWTLD